MEFSWFECHAHFRVAAVFVILYSNSMQQKICFSKKAGYLVSIGLVIVLLAGTLNILTNQKTSTNSRASEVIQPSVFPTRLPIACNARGAYVIKDLAGQLWSWASLKTGVLCSSEKILTTDPSYSAYLTKAILYPDTPRSGTYRFMEQYVLKGAICTRYGVDMDIEFNKDGVGLYAPFDPSLNPTYLTTIPARLVATDKKPKMTDGGGMIPDFFARTKCSSSGTNPICQGRIMTIGARKWNVGYIYCSSLVDNKKGCCSADITMTSTATSL